MNVPFLRRGTGQTPAEGGCIMQIVDWISTGGWSDAPLCVNRNIAAWAIAANDNLDDQGRQKLLDLTSRIMGTDKWSLNLGIALDRKMSSLRAEWDNGNLAFKQHAQQEYWLRAISELCDVYDEVMGRERTDETVDYSSVCKVLDDRFVTTA